MHELSLFTGCGGGVLGSHLLGWRPVGYVEIDDYCQRVIAQRIEDGFLPEAPIFGDVRAFIGEGYADRYRGMVDVVTAGFPCPPFSVAGKRLGGEDPRNLWPETAECIRRVRPRFALLENVPGLLADRYFGRVLGDLAESGYDCRWDCLPASAVGANHRRDRLWIVATDTSETRRRRHRWSSNHAPELASQDGSERHLPDANGFDDGHGNDGRRSVFGSHPASPHHERWWLTEPDVGRVVDGVASRVDRLRAIGNGQVPAVVRAAWHALSRGIG